MPVFVVANDVHEIDSAIQDVIDASRNLNAETSRICQSILSGQGVFSEDRAGASGITFLPIMPNATEARSKCLSLLKTSVNPSC